MGVSLGEGEETRINQTLRTYFWSTVSFMLTELATICSSELWTATGWAFSA